MKKDSGLTFKGIPIFTDDECPYDILAIGEFQSRWITFKDKPFIADDPRYESFLRHTDKGVPFLLRVLKENGG